MLIKVLLLVLVVGELIFRLRFSPTQVEAHSVTKGDIVAEVLGTGTLEARVKTTVSSKIQGRLTEMPVDQNDCVADGQLLARLDDNELRQQVEIAEASLTVARASVERVRADESRSQATVKQARQAYERTLSLVTQKAVSQSELDKAVETARVAEADFRRVAAAITEAELQVVTAEKTLRYQEERLRDTEIVSPFEGLIVRRDRDPGDIVVPGGSILQLVSTKEMWISAWVDETAMAELATGQPARVVFRSVPDKSYPGEVVRLGLEVDRETREFLVDVRVKELPANWAIGQRAEIHLETGRKPGAVIVPERMLAWHSDKPGVFVMDGDKARWRPVTLGLRGREEVEILQGLAIGDCVIVSSNAEKPLVEGLRVSVP